MSKVIHYFAYGSNLHPVRLRERISSAKLVDIGRLKGFRLLFHKLGQDGSGKCNLLRTESDTDLVHGAIYSMDQKHKSRLDAFEGNGAGYINQQIMVTCRSGTKNCYTYLAQADYVNDSLKPYHWYKLLVVKGARYLGFPHSYIASIETVSSVEDQESSRRKTHHQLLDRIGTHMRRPDK